MTSRQVNFLSVDEVFTIHERLVVRFGGREGIRDRCFPAHERVGMDVVGPEAHAFLVGLLERGETDFQHLLPWIRASFVRS